MLEGFLPAFPRDETARGFDIQGIIIPAVFFQSFCDSQSVSIIYARVADEDLRHRSRSLTAICVRDVRMS